MMTPAFSLQNLHALISMPNAQASTVQFDVQIDYSDKQHLSDRLLIYSGLHNYADHIPFDTFCFSLNSYTKGG